MSLSHNEFDVLIRRMRWLQARLEQIAHDIGTRGRELSATPPDDTETVHRLSEEVRKLSAEADVLYAEVLQIKVYCNKPDPVPQPKRPRFFARLLGRPA